MIVYCDSLLMLAVNLKLATKIIKKYKINPRGVVAKVLDYEIIENEFVLQSRYYVYFRPEEKYEPHPISYGSSTRVVLALNEPQSLIYL